MHYEEFMRFYVMMENLVRQTGRTTALAEACKKIDGIFLATSVDQANWYKRKFNVNSTVPTSKELIGTRKPIILDHYLLYCIFKDVLYEESRRHPLYMIFNKIRTNKKILPIFKAKKSPYPKPKTSYRRIN